MLVYNTRYHGPWTPNHILSWWLFFCNLLLPTGRFGYPQFFLESYGGNRTHFPTIDNVRMARVPVVVFSTFYGFLNTDWPFVYTVHTMTLCVIAPNSVLSSESRPFFLCVCNCLASFIIIDKFQILQWRWFVSFFPPYTFRGWLN